ncbi:Phosphoserine phosphatase rsbX [Georgfuchsia toluolica]|uniref:Phosphoserine phosphatase rsbX n=2 Tax=Georgfuchsia toluolica TaxID=424218 RepID=A0A916J3G0_9PROT|nr:Phosphoserine phosphatase rsbX [Georgfuchsia toluolica]
MSPPQTVDIRYESSVGEARRAAQTLAAALGFVPQACDDIALAMTELATNLIKHAGGGSLTLTPLAENGRVGLEIRSRDTGRGIANVELALGDRFSTAEGSRGTGLGAINRLMDELDIDSQHGGGTDIVCRKWRREYQPSVRPCPLGFGVATRPRTFGQANGDAFVVHQWAESALVGVIDGLGHGQFAHRAAQTAYQYVETHFDLPLDQIFRGTGRACRATRGVVMALARFDWGHGRLTFAAVGNILMRVFPRSEPFHFVVRRGVIGLNAPKAVVTEHSWCPDQVLVLHSDGISAHWGWQDFPGWANKPAEAMARELLQAKAKAEDDATVIVVRNAIP